MNHHLVDAIRSFVSRDPSPAFTDFLSKDAPQYEWTKGLVEALVGKTLTWNQTPALGTAELLSDDGTTVLRIKTSQAGPPTTDGLMAEDLRALLSAIRIHEVESYDLVMLPPEMRKADLDYLCKKVGLTTEKLRRFTDLWMSEK